MNEKLLYATNMLVSRCLNAGKSSGKNFVRDVLVVKWDEIGDMATAVHVFDLIKKSHPAANVTVLCKPFVASLLKYHPAVSNVITDIALWNRPFDVVVELRGTWKTLWKSMHWTTMPKYRVDRGWIRFQQRGNQPHELLTNYRIVEPLLADEDRGLSISDLLNHRMLYPNSDDKLAAKAWREWAMEGATVDFKGYAILHTGARSELRRWSTQRYVKVSNWLFEEQKLMPIWVGTTNERAQIEEAMKLGALGKVWISGEISPKNNDLLAFYQLIAEASLYVGNESGPLQLADIAKVPLVAIYGPGVPHVFYPQSPNSRVLHEVLSCNPCDQIQCIQPQDRCVDRISVEGVKMAVCEVLAASV